MEYSEADLMTFSFSVFYSAGLPTIAKMVVSSSPCLPSKRGRETSSLYIFTAPVLSPLYSRAIYCFFAFQDTFLDTTLKKWRCELVRGGILSIRNLKWHFCVKIDNNASPYKRGIHAVWEELSSYTVWADTGAMWTTRMRRLQKALMSWTDE